MQTGDDNNQAPPRTSDEITGSLWRRIDEALSDHSMESNDEVRNYLDAVRVLSEVELPSPSPVHATSCTMTRDDSFNRLHQGQSSGTKDKANDIEGNVERQRDLKSKQRDSPQRGSRRESTKTNITEKRRRNKISERIRTLQTLVPNCNKELNLQHLQRDNASILGDAIEYIKFLQMQVQMVQSMGIGHHMSQGLYMTLPRQPSLQVPNLAPNFTMSPFINMQHGIPQVGSYVPVNHPIFPTSFSGFRPPMEVGTRSFPWTQPRPDLYPQQQRLPSHISQSVYSTTPSSGTIIPTTYSQGGSRVPGQPLYHVPMTSDEGTGLED